MKKLILTFAIILAVGIGSASAQRSLLGKSDAEKAGNRDITTPKIVAQHEQNTNGEASTPLGSGVAVLLGLGAAYMVAKKRKKD